MDFELSEDEVALADGMRRHESGLRAMTQRLGALSALRAGTTPERAAAHTDRGVGRAIAARLALTTLDR